LQRLAANRYGNEPLNWVVRPPTAGSIGADHDGDGLPDDWETTYFGAIDDPRARPDFDADNDLMTNLQEWISGTSPVESASYLKVVGVSRAANGVEIEFAARADRTYSIVYRDSAAAGLWQKLGDVLATGTDRMVVVTDPAVGGVPTRVYRLVTPRLP
jgi:hypothetical protein